MKKHLQWMPRIAAVAVIIVCQCVFFNVFYNAKASYDIAYHDHHKLIKNNPDSILASLPADIQTNYDRAIEKAKKVLEEFPKDKKWHADAIFLMGKANYYKGDYEKSIRNMSQLQEEFPASPFVPESFLYMARDYIRIGSMDRAEQTLSMILEKYPDLNNDQQVSLLLAEVALGREGKSMALEVLEKAASKIKSKERKIDLAVRTAGLAMSLKQYDKAIAILKRCPRDNKYPDKLFLVDMTLVDCYIGKDSLHTALTLTSQMIAYKLFGAYIPYIQLKKASIYTAMNHIDEAISTYLLITDIYAPAPASTTATPGSSSAALPGQAAYKGAMSTSSTGSSPPPQTAQTSSPPNPAATGIASAAGQAVAGTALYELGILFLTKKGDFVKAKDYFSRAMSIAQDTAVKAKATQRVKSIDSLFAYRIARDTVDTAKGKGLKNALDFKIGELFWLEMGLPDSAFAHFKRLAASGDSIRPKALYSASYISRSGLKDTAVSDSLFKVLLKDFPSNMYTKKAQRDRGDSVTVRTRLDSAQDAFVAAESLYCFLNKPEEAATAFKSVYEAYSDCESGQQALYAAAWLNDELLKNNKTAYKLYRTLCDSFPKCALCTTAVKPRLKTVSDTLAARKARGAKIKPTPAPVSPAVSKTKAAPSVQAPQAGKQTPAQPGSPAAAQSDSLLDIKDQDPKRLDSLRRENANAPGYRDRFSRYMRHPAQPAPPTQPTASSPQSGKGSLSGDSASASSIASPAQPTAVKPVQSPAAPPVAAPAAIKAPVAPPTPPPVKDVQPPKTESKSEDTDSVEVVGQPGK